MRAAWFFALAVLALLAILSAPARADSGWTPTVYVQFPDEATARTAATALGADFPADGGIPTGTRNYALVAPITEWVTRPTIARDGSGDPGEACPGYWAMMRFNLDTAEGAAAYAQLQAYGVIRTRATPSNVFQ